MNGGRGAAGRLILHARTVEQATPRTRRIVLGLEGQALPFTAGQAVWAGLADGTQRRPYSIACSPAQAAAADAIELLVQIDDHQPPDPHLERVTAGTAVAIEGPFGSFTLAPIDDDTPVLLVAGGTGIAPLRAMLWERMARLPVAPLTLLYSVRAPEEFAYLVELQELAEAGRIDLLLTVTRPAAAWAGGRGRIDGQLLLQGLRGPATVCALCGPPAFVRDTMALLTAAGVPAAQIRWEASA